MKVNRQTVEREKTNSVAERALKSAAANIKVQKSFADAAKQFGGLCGGGEQ